MSATDIWVAEDPEPLPDSASEQEMDSYKMEVEKYCKEMYECFKNSEFRNEPLWIEVCNTFREPTIRMMSKTMVINWIELLLVRGVHVNRARHIRRTDALVQCLKSKDFIPLTLADDVDKKDNKKELESIVDDKKGNSESMSTGSPGQEYIRNKFLELNNNNNSSEHPNIERQDSYTRQRTQEMHSMGIPGMIRSYQNRKKFSGAWDDNLEQALATYETFAKVCKLSDTEKAEAIPYMLSDDAFTFYTAMISSDLTYEEIIEKLKAWYTSPEKKTRILSIWQNIRLSKEMESNSEKSEVEVFKTFSTKLVALQKQLSDHYQHDDLLRDQYITAVDNPKIQQALREKIPQTSQDAANRITTFLSDNPGSARNFSTNQDESSALYSLGMRYGGNAEGINSRNNSRFRNDRRLSSNWIRGVRGCYVCGKNHRAASQHSPEQVRDAIRKLKKEHPKALISVEDMAFITEDLDRNVGDDEPNMFESSDEGYFALEEEKINQSMETDFANISFQHGRSFIGDREKWMNNMDCALFTEAEPKFKGIMFDTCANRSSIMSYSEYKQYCIEFKVPFKICWNDINKKTISGIGGERKAIGTAMVPIPFKDLGIVVDVKFQIMENYCPTLLSMKDIKDNGLDLSIQNQTVTYGKKSQRLIFENYFLIHRWKPQDMDYVLYTNSELKRLHRVFGHPSVNALNNILKRANPHNVDSSVKECLEEIKKRCDTCQRHAAKPRRFKITVGSEDLKFNHTIAVDIMYMSGKPVLHIVDEATHFNAAQFLKRQTTAEIWRTISRCWSRVYLGPPDFIHVDQGSNLISEEFKSSAYAEDIKVLEAPIESPSTMSHVERYHLPLKSAYQKIRETLKREETDADCLQLAVKAVNDTIGPEGLCPTLLVFGSFPRPPRSIPTPTQLERAKAKELASREYLKEISKRKISFALKHFKGPKGKENSEQLKQLPAGAPVYVYRETKNSWTGPYPFISIDGESVVVQLPKGRKLFRSSVVKPRNGSVFNSCYVADEILEISDEVCEALFGSTSVRLANKNEAHKFKESRQKEIKGLNEKTTFRVVKEKTVPNELRIYGTRFVDSFKTVDGIEQLKSRLVAQNYQDLGASKISTKSPTISRLGQRTVVCLAPCYKTHKAYIRDIIQAYAQAKTELERPIYLRPPPEMGLEDDDVLLVLRPLYGIPESGLHWFITFQGHHTNNLNMIPAQVDPCILSYKNNGVLEGLTTLQVDDVFGHGTVEFLKNEETESLKFKSKPRKVLEKGDSVVFNGTTISYNNDGSYTLAQKEKLEGLELAKSEKDFHSIRAKIQYVAVMTRPDICAEIQLLSNGTSVPTNEEMKRLNKVIQYCKRTYDIGLKYVELDLESTKLVLFTDSSFANAKNMKSQIGFVIAMVDKNNRANILHYGSSRCQRVTRSVMASEIHALLFGFDNAIVAKNLLEEVTGKTFEIHALVDSRTLFNVVAKDAKTLEKRLQIDIYSIKESLKSKKELKSLGWIPGADNVSDGLTKGLINNNHPLWTLITTNKIDLKRIGWIENI